MKVTTQLTAARKWAVLTVSAEFFLAVLKGPDPNATRSFRILENALPDDARIARVGWSDYGELQLVIESRTFAEVPENERLPALKSPVFEYVQDRP